MAESMEHVRLISSLPVFHYATNDFLLGYFFDIPMSSCRFSLTWTKLEGTSEVNTRIVRKGTGFKLSNVHSLSTFEPTVLHS